MEGGAGLSVENRTANAVWGISEEAGGVAGGSCVFLEKRLLTEWSRGAFAGMRLSVTRYAPGTLMPPHSHATASVSLVVRGVFAERIDGAGRAGPGLSVIVKPAGVVHETLCGSGCCQTVSLELPSRIESQLRVKLGAFARVGHEDDAELTAALIALWRRALERDIANDDAWVERWWGSCGALMGRERVGRSDGRLATALAVGARGGSAGEAADAVGVHRVHLCRLFRAANGRGTAANFRRARVRRAIDEMGRSVSLAGVASGCGFADQAHMTRAFVRETGTTPGVLRGLMAGRV
ncbi:MAG TPA: helix-turn-helix domain-containing protein [Phycisphaerales bacterium]